jgi:hypothetical protein
MRDGPERPTPVDAVARFYWMARIGRALLAKGAAPPVLHLHQFCATGSHRLHLRLAEGVPRGDGTAQVDRSRHRADRGAQTSWRMSGYQGAGGSPCASAFVGHSPPASSPVHHTQVLRPSISGPAICWDLNHANGGSSPMAFQGPRVTGTEPTLLGRRRRAAPYSRRAAKRVLTVVPMPGSGRLREPIVRVEMLGGYPHMRPAAMNSRLPRR